MCTILENFGFRFFQLEKNSTWSLKNRKFFNFIFKVTLLQSPFFSKNKHLIFCSKLAQTKLKVSKCAQFWELWDSVFSKWKKVHLKFEKSKIFGLYFQNHSTTEAFFLEKKVLWFCSKLAQMKFRANKFAIFCNIWDFMWKSWKI